MKVTQSPDGYILSRVLSDGKEYAIGFSHEVPEDKAIAHAKRSFLRKELLIRGSEPPAWEVVE